MIHLEIDGDIARLMLARPETRNALAMRHWQALEQAFGDVASSDARLLVVTGEGGAFSAGADLGEFARFRDDGDARRAFTQGMRGALEALAALPIATLAWIDGPCFGAGVALAMACDLRIAAPHSRFAITPAKMGIGYPQEDVARLVALVGPGHASRLLFTGTAIDAVEALRIGFVEMVGDEAVRDAVIGDLRAAAPTSIAMLKRGIALAGAGETASIDQDMAFDTLLGSDLLANNLSRRRSGRGLPPAKP